MDTVVRRRLHAGLLLGATAVAVLVLAGPGLSHPSAAAETTSVEAGNDYFCSSAYDGSSCETDVTAGDTVTWNVVAGSHTVTECTSDFTQCPPGNGFDSGILVDGQTYSQTFDSPGTYTYRCELHTSEMLGKIVVAAASVTPSPTPETSVTTPSVAPAPTATPAALPPTGGSPQGGTSLVTYALLAFGLAVIAGSIAVLRGRGR